MTASPSDGITVIIPTCNPRPELLPGLVAALARQTLSPARWEVFIVDNASREPLSPDLASLASLGVPAIVVREPRPGLTYARLAGFARATRPLIVMLDDDNLPRPDFLERALDFAARHPEAGTFGGRVRPVFAAPPPPWFEACGVSLGCQDFGDEEKITPAALRPDAYPAHAPVGGGMVLRREVARSYAEHLSAQSGAVITDRQGGSLSSGGDCEIVLVGRRHGWATGYSPELFIEHLIPAGRLLPGYLARLNRESSRSWVRLLARHGINPWPPVRPATVPLRKLRAWFVHRAWRGPLPRIAWSGACGIFEGRADIFADRRPPRR